MRFGLLFLSLSACTEHHAEPHDVAIARVERLESLVAQIEYGRQLYAGQCASCHGDAGQGTIDGPMLFGAGGLALEPAVDATRDVPFRSVADVLAWTMKAMPADNPASLTADQYVAVTAYVITARGVTLDRPLDAANAHAIALQLDETCSPSHAFNAAR